ncbi:class I SAM-dependent methyltransferase [Moraxella oblonga]|uniref:class I SAM-dependent methyltransferase n=1 Tax=Moraxella oblonga TaxID=200413 RepID=UPI000834E648|nr:methyltransferase domain-containing protein [Moraxella oblonga]
MDLKESDILGDDVNKHWYYIAKARAMQNILHNVQAKTVLDVGAGSGYFSRYLLEHSNVQAGVCVDISYPTEYDDTHSGKPLYFRRSILDTAQAGIAPVDLCLMMDVLEHVEDDVGLLKTYVEQVPSGTKFLISVPAFQFLWSSHDVFLEHYRRYTCQHLAETVQSSGLNIIQNHYYFGAVFPIALTMRLFERIFPKKETKSQLVKHHPLTNAILLTASQMEIPFQKWNRLAGLTVFCLAEKP